MATTRIFTERVKHLHLPALSSGRSWGKQLVQTWSGGRGGEKKRKKVDREKRGEWRREMNKRGGEERE